MIKKNKWQLIISSIVILLPALFCIFAGKLLPERIAIHWNAFGEADGFGSAKIFFAALPLILLAIHWTCILLSVKLDKNAAEQNKKIMNIMFWIIPFISLSSSSIAFMTALGYGFNVLSVVMIILGVAFVIIGNYMPKITRSRTAGIKMKWTYSSEENWNATHRFAGKVFVATGVLCFLATPLPSVAFPFIAIAIILISVIPVTVYSYRIYKKQLADGSVTRESAEQAYLEYTGIKNKKALTAVIVSVTAVLTVVLALTMFSGSVTATLDETSLTVDSTYWSDITVKYGDITAVEYREEGVDGERIGGFGSATLLLGNFSNKELGAYTRYTYTGKRPCVIVTVGSRTLVVGLKDAQETWALYEGISQKISE